MFERYDRLLRRKLAPRPPQVNAQKAAASSCPASQGASIGLRIACNAVHAGARSLVGYARHPQAAIGVRYPSAGRRWQRSWQRSKAPNQRVLKRPSDVTRVVTLSDIEADVLGLSSMRKEQRFADDGDIASLDPRNARPDYSIAKIRVRHR
jgi:hypothetical protein